MGVGLSDGVSVLGGRVVGGFVSTTVGEGEGASVGWLVGREEGVSVGAARMMEGEGLVLTTHGAGPLRGGMTGHGDARVATGRGTWHPVLEGISHGCCGTAAGVISAESRFASSSSRFNLSRSFEAPSGTVIVLRGILNC